MNTHTSGITNLTPRGSGKENFHNENVSNS